jgi:hypothetical protein
MGLDALSSAQLYMCSRRQCDESFPRNKDAFLFQSPALSGHETEESKSLEV